MSSEKRGGKKKRWFEQFYPSNQDQPPGTVRHPNKMPVFTKRMQGKHTKACRCQQTKAAETKK